MISPDPIYLTRRVITTKECLATLDPIERKICEYLVRIGDIVLVDQNSARIHQEVNYHVP